MKKETKAETSRRLAMEFEAKLSITEGLRTFSQVNERYDHNKFHASRCLLVNRKGTR